MRLLFGLQLTQSREILGAALHEISAHPVLWNAMLCNDTDHHWVTPYLLGRFCGPGGLPVRAARLPETPLKGLTDAGDAEIREWLGLAAPEPISLESLGQECLYLPGVEFGQRMAPRMGGGRHPKRHWDTRLLWPLMQRWLPARGFMGRFADSGQKQKRCLILRFHRFLFYQDLPVVSHWSTGREFSKDTLNLYDCTASREATHTLPITDTALYPENLDRRRYLALEPQSLWFLEKI